MLVETLLLRPVDHPIQETTNGISRLAASSQNIVAIEFSASGLRMP